MSIEIFGANKVSDLPQGTNIRMVLEDDTIVFGTMNAPMAVRTIREGLRGYAIRVGDRVRGPGFSLDQIKIVEVLNIPDPLPETPPRVDNWPDGTVLHRHSEGRPQRVYVKSGTRWYRSGMTTGLDYRSLDHGEFQVFGPTGAKVTL